MKFTKTLPLVTVVAALATFGTAQAAAIDVSATVSSITDNIASVTAIGMAVLAIVVVVKVFKFVRAAL